MQSWRIEERALQAVKTVNPGYFALVMATGIVSVAMVDEHASTVSTLLLWLSGIEFVVLVAVYLWRLIAFPRAMRADVSDPAKAFGFFTLVAAIDVLGTRLVGDGHHRTALILLAVGSAAWLGLGYVIPWTAALGLPRRPVLPHANGTWFIWAVASQSVAVLAATLESTVVRGQSELASLAVFCWGLGVVLYAAAAVFVAARSLVYELRPSDLTPPYWVSMGATAITVVAGAKIAQMVDAPMVDATRGLIAQASVIFWVFGTWLIPPLLAAGIWRHVVRRIPLRYEAGLWGMVFPLGMYGVASTTLGQADRLPILRDVGSYEGWVALAAWVVTFVAMLVHLVRSLGRPGIDAPPG